MQRRPVFYSNKPERKNLAELSPRLSGKKHDNLPSSAVLAQASAQMKRRKQEAKPLRLQSPLYSRQQGQLKKISEQKQMLTQDQIRNSALYKMLEQQIKELAKRQEEEIEKLKKIRDERRKEAEEVRKEQFATKLQIWELKNQVCDIRELIQEEKAQNERLTEEVRPNLIPNSALDAPDNEDALHGDQFNDEEYYETEDEV